MGSLKKLQADYASGIDAPRNYIREGHFDHGTKGFSTYKESSAVTFDDTTDEVTHTAHGKSNGETASFTTIVTSTGIVIDTLYYLIEVTTNAYKVSLTRGGSAVDITGGAGTGTAVYGRPVAGTGGSPNITITRTTSSPLKGTASGLITKQAANRMGEGIAYDFTIDRKHQAKVLYQSFLYEVASGAYTDSALSAFIYGPIDGTPVVTELSPRDIQNSGLIEQFDSAFQTALVGTQYRLCLHISSPDVVAYTMKVDEFKAVEKRGIKNSIITEWKAYTPTFSASIGTINTADFWWRQEGDSVRVKGLLNSTGGSASEAQIGLPFGTVDSVKNPQLNYVGNMQLDSINNTSNNIGSSYSVMADGGNSYVGFSSRGSAGTGFALGNGAGLNGSDISMEFLVPVTGLGATTEIFGDADTRVMAASYSVRDGQSVGTGAGNVILFIDKDFDTHGSYNTSTGVYTIKLPGKFRFSGRVATSGTTGAITTTVDLKKNGTIVRTSQAATYWNGSAYGPWCDYDFLIECVFGDEIEIFAASDVATAIDTNIPARTVLNIERLSGPAQIAASEVEAFSASTNDSGFSFAALTDTKTEWDEIRADKLSGWDSINNKYIVRTPGVFKIDGNICVGPVGAIESLTVSLKINGVAVRGVQAGETAATTGLFNPCINFSFMEQLSVGDEIEIWLISSQATAYDGNSPDRSNLNIYKL